LVGSWRWNTAPWRRALPSSGCGDSCSRPLHNAQRTRGGRSMTKSSRVAVVGLLLFGVLVVAATSCSQKRPAIAVQLAKTYGLASFEQIDAIRYTFNLELAALNLNLSRSWVWEPKTGQVSYEGKDKDGQTVKVTYLRSQLASQPANVKDD